MTIVRIALVAASVTFAATLTGAANAKCRDFVCGLFGEIASAVQKGPHAAAQEAAVDNPATEATPDARGTLQKKKKKRFAVKKRHASAKARLRRAAQPPTPVMLPERDPVPVVTPDPVVAPDEVNAIDLAAGPEPAPDGEQDATADDLPHDGIRNDDAARMALATALYDKAHRLRNTPNEPPAKSWLERAWAVVADALSAAQTAVRTLIG